MSGVVGVLEHGIRDVTKQYGIDGLELEFRFGRVLGGRFVPGVPKDHFDKLYTMLTNSPGFHSTDIETRETLADSNRKYVITVSDSVNPVPPPPRWGSKHRMHVVDMGPVGSGALVYRASLAYEDWGVSQAPPPDVKYERWKVRRSFRRGDWIIDMTQVRTNLPDHLDEPEHGLEVEIELARPELFFRRTRQYVIDYAMNMVKDLVNIMEN